SILPAAIAGAGIEIRDRLAAVVEVLGFDRAGQRNHNAYERRRPTRSTQLQPIHVGDAARRSVDIEDQPQSMATGAERDCAAWCRGPRLPAAGIRHLDRSGHVCAVYFEVQRATGSGGCNPEREIVLAVGGDVDRVLEPLAGTRPSNVVTAARVSRRFDVDVRGAELTSLVAHRAVVVGDALTSFVEFLGLDNARDGPRRASLPPS